ncbi:MAG: Zn-dependent oligopeptidase [Verrucomicrobia bacterium]|nr:Zn-dependent oligopeptidase [Verrucomicrobiota bacterium]
MARAWRIEILLAGLLTALPGSTAQADLKSLETYQAAAARFGSQLTVPELETTPEQITSAVDHVIQTANARLDEIGAMKPAETTFTNTALALDDLAFQAGRVGNRLGLIKETSTNAALREAATQAIKRFEEWAVGLDYREDVYRAVQACADTPPKLSPEDAKLLAETLRDYRRAGLALPRAERDEVERLRKELARLCTDFDSNIRDTQQELTFTRQELVGVPDSFFSRPGIKTGDDAYTIKVNITWQRLMILENARREDVRRRVDEAACRLAMDKNVGLLQQIVELRDKIAHRLGYASWADYKTEVKMARHAAAATQFLNDLRAGLQPKFESELEELRQLKAADTADTNAVLGTWDWRYYENQLKKQRYNVDAEALRVYFPYQAVLRGMFDIYQRMFGLRFEEVQPPSVWSDGVRLYAVLDAQSGEPLGLFYLDMFPREGKYNHFAHFSIVDGKRLPDGKYQRPVSALICNFPPPQPDEPSLLSHDEVETLFHEFGHAMHATLTRANHARFSGTSVPRDFVEAPSQMLENWVWDKKVLDGFAADYRDPSKKIPADVLNQLDAARKSTLAIFYRRQIAFGLLDLALHTHIHPGDQTNVVELSNQILSDVFLPVPTHTAFVAYFGHLTGYDAGYYGYAWADAIAADMAKVFETAPDGYLDVATGSKLRKEIYEPGDSRDVSVSIEAFLGRAHSTQPFLEELGIATP